MAITEKLTAIAEAIREKGGTTELLTLAQMPEAIAALEVGGGSGGTDGVPETISFTDAQLSAPFQGNMFDWIYNNFGDRIKTSGISNCANMFKDCTKLEKLPFAINTGNYASGTSFSNAFSGCTNLKQIDYPLNNIAATSSMFATCRNLRELPEMTFKYGAAGGTGMFQGCVSLRRIPEEIMSRISSTSSTYYSHHLWNLLQACYVLDEVVGLQVGSGVGVTSNLFNGWTPSEQKRAKEFKFALNSDGTPQKWSAHSQTLDMSGTGIWTLTDSNITNYNTGITTDKKVTDAASYERLKNDPDWYTGNKAYSRYNLQSAINTINSLPDTSEYLASQTNKTNTIKFNGNSGSHTDGGKIADMPEDVIALAASRGWTVTITQQ